MEDTDCVCHNRPSVVVHGKVRCRVSGHRIAVRGIPPRQTREQPPWTWPGEIIGRRLARRS